MDMYHFTEYFEEQVLRKRPYIHKAWCIKVLENPLRVEPQENNRYRFWGEVPELPGKIFSCVLKKSKFDSSFKNPKCKEQKKVQGRSVYIHT